MGDMKTFVFSTGGEVPSRVQIMSFRGLIKLPWKSQQELLRFLRGYESAREIVAAFEDVGTSRPVKLTATNKGSLLVLIERWWDERVTVDALPAGVADLWHALADDVRPGATCSGHPEQDGGTGRQNALGSSSLRGPRSPARRIRSPGRVVRLRRRRRQNLG
jgi:hypothetical protein